MVLLIGQRRYKDMPLLGEGNYKISALVFAIASRMNIQIHGINDRLSPEESFLERNRRSMEASVPGVRLAIS